MCICIADIVKDVVSFQGAQSIWAWHIKELVLELQSTQVAKKQIATITMRHYKNQKQIFMIGYRVLDEVIGSDLG